MAKRTFVRDSISTFGNWHYINFQVKLSKHPTFTYSILSGQKPTLKHSAINKCIVTQQRERNTQNSKFEVQKQKCYNSVECWSRKRQFA